MSDAALIFVPDIVGESTSVALKSVNLADTALTEVPLIFPPLRFVRAEMLVPDMVGESTSVALKSTTLVAAEKLTAPVTVPPDRGK
jgi:hypothetical protein